METPSPDKITKWYNFYQRFLKPHFDSYQRKESVVERFAEIFDDISNKTHSAIIADKIGAVLQERFKEIHSSMKNNEEEFQNLLIEVVKSIENHLNQTVNVWKDRIIYFRDVNEVWVACEPMLDLIDDEQGSFDLLERQLLHVDKITYFVTDKTYFDDLLNILNNRNMDTSKLVCEIIPNKLPHPVVIYHTSSYMHGMRGKEHPRIKKSRSNGYYFQKNIEKDWLSYLSKEYINKYYQDLLTLKAS